MDLSYHHKANIFAVSVLQQVYGTKELCCPETPLLFLIWLFCAACWKGMWNCQHLWLDSLHVPSFGAILTERIFYLSSVSTLDPPPSPQQVEHVPQPDFVIGGEGRREVVNILRFWKEESWLKNRASSEDLHILHYLGERELSVVHQIVITVWREWRWLQPSKPRAKLGSKI